MNFCFFLMLSLRGITYLILKAFFFFLLRFCILLTWSAFVFFFFTRSTFVHRLHFCIRLHSICFFLCVCPLLRLLVGFVFIFFFHCDDFFCESRRASKNQWARGRIKEFYEEREVRMTLSSKPSRASRIKLVTSHEANVSKRSFLIYFLILGHFSFGCLK